MPAMVVVAMVMAMEIRTDKPPSIQTPSTLRSSHLYVCERVGWQMPPSQSWHFNNRAEQQMRNAHLSQSSNHQPSIRLLFHASARLLSLVHRLDESDWLSNRASASRLVISASVSSPHKLSLLSVSFLELSPLLSYLISFCVPIFSSYHSHCFIHSFIHVLFLISVVI